MPVKNYITVSVRRKRIILREMAVALGILVLFLFFGKYILAGLHISEPALSIAGGVILLLISIKMIFPGQKAVVTGEEPESEEKKDETTMSMV